jgi:hypothetical protein
LQDRDASAEVESLRASVFSLIPQPASNIFHEQSCCENEIDAKLNEILGKLAQHFRPAVCPTRL